ncbi:ArsR family transcriptional regulator [Faecalicatena contorta]
MRVEKYLAIDWPSVSHHLQILKDAGIVNMRGAFYVYGY